MTTLPLPPTLQEPPEKPKKSRARTKPGERITLWRVISTLQEFTSTYTRGPRPHGPGFSVYANWGGGYRGLKHTPLLYLARLQFQTVVNAALEGRIYECLYLDAEPKCRCRDCDKARVKNPRKKAEKLIAEVDTALGTPV